MSSAGFSGQQQTFTTGWAVAMQSDSSERSKTGDVPVEEKKVLLGSRFQIACKST
jgi:hypothetical protein